MPTAKADVLQFLRFSKKNIGRGEKTKNKRKKVLYKNSAQMHKAQHTTPCPTTQYVLIKLCILIVF